MEYSCTSSSTSLTLLDQLMLIHDRRSLPTDIPSQSLLLHTSKPLPQVPHVFICGMGLFYHVVRPHMNVLKVHLHYEQNRLIINDCLILMQKPQITECSLTLKFKVRARIIVWEMIECSMQQWKHLNHLFAVTALLQLSVCVWIYFTFSRKKTFKGLPFAKFYWEPQDVLWWHYSTISLYGYFIFKRL